MFIGLLRERGVKELSLRQAESKNQVGFLSVCADTSFLLENNSPLHGERSGENKPAVARAHTAPGPGQALNRGALPVCVFG